MRATIVSHRLVIGLALAGIIVVAVTTAFAVSINQDVPSDSEATAAFVRAYHAQAREGRIASAQGERALQRFLLATGKACGGVLAHAPRHGAAFGGIEEAITDMLQLKLVRPSVSSAERFARTIRPLRWTSTDLTTRVRAFATSQDKETAILPPEPPLCNALLAWSRGGYASVPAVLLRFGEGFRTAAASEPSPVGGDETTILRRLRRYESPRERMMVRDAVALTRATASDTVEHLYRAKRELYRVLGTEPLVY